MKTLVTLFSAAMTATQLFAEAPAKEPAEHSDKEPAKTATAAAESLKNKNLTFEERRAIGEKTRIAKMKATGGYLYQPDTSKGRVVFFDCRSGGSVDVIKDATENMTPPRMRINFAVEKATSVPKPADVGGFLSGKKATFGIFVAESKDDPTTLSIFPEQRYAVVNASAVGGSEKRLKTELIRAFAFLCGAASSQYKESMMSAVRGSLDLDTIKSEHLPIDTIQRIVQYLKEFDVEPSRYATYRKAVEEGWAPQPTNEFQKVIWDQVRSIPTKPIKIEP